MNNAQNGWDSRKASVCIIIVGITRYVNDVLPIGFLRWYFIDFTVNYLRLSKYGIPCGLNIQWISFDVKTLE